MKSKLTLRIDDEVKRDAKQLARARGESLSGMVETYFRLLTESTPSEDETGSSSPSSRPEEFGPVTKRIKGALGTISDSPEHGSSKKRDRRAVAQAAHRKHG